MALWAEWARPDLDGPRRQALRHRLVTAYLPLAGNIAARFAGRGESFEDLQQIARIGLINAVDRFDPERGSDFVSFAVPTIMGEVRRYFRDSSWSLRVPRRLKELHLALSKAVTTLSQSLGRAPTPSEIATHLKLDVEVVREGLLAGQSYQAISTDLPLGGENGATTLADRLGADEPALENFENRDAVQRLLGELAPRERAVLVMRFFDGLPQSRIAEQIGVSQMQVSRILAKTLAQLRDRLAADA